MKKQRAANAGTKNAAGTRGGGYYLPVLPFAAAALWRFLSTLGLDAPDWGGIGETLILLAVLLCALRLLCLCVSHRAAAIAAGVLLGCAAMLAAAAACIRAGAPDAERLGLCAAFCLTMALCRAVFADNGTEVVCAALLCALLPATFFGALEPGVGIGMALVSAGLLLLGYAAGAAFVYCLPAGALLLAAAAAIHPYFLCPCAGAALSLVLAAPRGRRGVNVIAAAAMLALGGTLRVLVLNGALKLPFLGSVASAAPEWTAMAAPYVVRLLTASALFSALRMLRHPVRAALPVVFGWTLCVLYRLALPTAAPTAALELVWLAPCAAWGLALLGRRT